MLGGIKDSQMGIKERIFKISKELRVVLDEINHMNSLANAKINNEIIKLNALQEAIDLTLEDLNDGKSRDEILASLRKNQLNSVDDTDRVLQDFAEQLRLLKGGSN